MSTGHIVLVATDARLLPAHLLPPARAALARGYAVTVVAPPGAEATAIAAAGARAVAFAAGRANLDPMAAGDAAGRLAGLLKALRPDLVHAVGPRGILVTGSACVLAGVPRRVYALVGVEPRAGHLGRLAQGAFGALVRGPLATRRTRFLAASAEDAAHVGLGPADPRLTLVQNGEVGDAAARLYGEMLA